MKDTKEMESYAPVSVPIVYIAKIVRCLYYIAVCSGGCSERGMCVAPERCECQTGWTGTQCTVGQTRKNVTWTNNEISSLCDLCRY